jgi:hypothetical protein
VAEFHVNNFNFDSINEGSFAANAQNQAYHQPF